MVNISANCNWASNQNDRWLPEQQDPAPNSECLSVHKECGLDRNNIAYWELENPDLARKKLNSTLTQHVFIIQANVKNNMNTSNKHT